MELATCLSDTLKTSEPLKKPGFVELPEPRKARQAAEAGLALLTLLQDICMGCSHAVSPLL
jgi:hypothetical protein